MEDGIEMFQLSIRFVKDDLKYKTLIVLFKTLIITIS